MKSHDVRVLRAILPQEVLDAYACRQLVHFRKNLQLPKTAWEAADPALLEVCLMYIKQKHSEVCIHLPIMLNMRQLHRAFHLLATNGEMATRGVPYEEDRTKNSIACCASLISLQRPK